MIIYLDSSIIVKLYREEEHSLDVEQLVDAADAVVTSALAYVECRAAFARALRMTRLNQARLTSRRGRRRDSDVQHAYRSIVDNFEADWKSRAYGIAPVRQRTVRLAGTLAEKHVLRAYDAVHLAAAIAVSRALSYGFSFSAFDPGLLTAAQAEGLSLAHEVN